METAASTACPVVVLISGNGSNLQALINQENAYRIVAVISNRPDAYGLKRAEQAGIPNLVIDHKRFDDRDSFDRALAKAIDGYSPGLVVLAGFMRILGEDFVHRFKGRLLNIHPSLLPLYPGMQTHARALAAGDKEHGASIHFVTEELDGGPVIAQVKVKVDAEDDEQSLQAKVATQEHRLYPEVVSWFGQGRLRFAEGTACLDEQTLLSPRILDT